MTELVLSRRNVVAGASLVLAGGSLATFISSPALADQGNMQAALRQLQNALNSLHRAPPNKGGHKERALELIQRAMGEVQAGIDFADEHGG